jgi:hypothetical protein
MIVYSKPVVSDLHVRSGGRTLLVMVPFYRLCAAHNLAIDVLLSSNQAHPGCPRDNRLHFCWYGRRVGRSSRAGDVD